MQLVKKTEDGQQIPPRGRRGNARGETPQNENSIAGDVRLPSPSLAGAFGNDALLAQIFWCFCRACASGSPGRISGVFRCATFVISSGVYTYALGLLLGLVFISLDGYG